MKATDINALVTGGSSGIGKATAKAIIETGGQAVICARSLDKLQKSAEEIGAIPIQCDVSSEKEVKSMVDKTVDHLENYNVLINNAGYGHFSELVNLSAEEFENQLRVNTIGAMLMARESAKYFIEQDYGNIINVSSTAGTKGFEGGHSLCGQ